MWRGTYFTGWEGSLRVPFIVRWPGKIPAGRVSNEIVHEIDLVPTLAAVAGGKVPTDRVVDGVNQLDFFTGKQETSNRDTVIVYVGDQLYAVKWRNWKVAFKELDAGYSAAISIYQTPSIYDLYLDPREEKPLVGTAFQQNGWVARSYKRSQRT
jgi:arylsulfatase A-like enzyme